MPRARRPKPLKAGLTERQVVAQLYDAARAFGVVLDRQNTGAAVNPKGRLVTFGVPGTPDLTGTLPGGRRLDVEAKRSDFDPAKLRGEKRDHFLNQIARMRTLNDRGGLAFWVNDVGDFVHVMKRAAEHPGLAVTFDEDLHVRLTWRE